MRQKRPQALDSPLIGFLLRHLAGGALGAALLSALLIYYDVANLGSLIFASNEPVLWIAMLFFSLFVTFGPIAMGIGIMSLGEERD